MNKMQCSDFGQAERRGKWSGKCRQVLSVWLRANAKAHSHSVVSQIEMIVAAATSLASAKTLHAAPRHEHDERNNIEIIIDGASLHGRCAQCSVLTPPSYASLALPIEGRWMARRRDL